MPPPAGQDARQDAPLVVDLADAAGDSAPAGGKAAGLARLIAAGLPVPPGFALTGAAFRAVIGADASHVGPARGGVAALDELGATLAAWGHAAEEHPIPAALEADVLARARALGAKVIVRSSMAIEDGRARAAPGVGRSIAGVAPDDVWTAVRAVWVASLTPMVALYARAESIDAIAAPGVVVQRAIAGVRATVYTRAPGRPDDDEVWVHVEGDGDSRETSGDGDARSVSAMRRATRGDGDRAVVLALAAERAIDAGAGADVELVRDDAGTWWVVQARPLVHPPPRKRRLPAPPFVLAGLRASGREWRRDVTHNPEPLSLAQTGLCELVERAGIAPFHLAVVAGFLYDAPKDGVAPVVAPTSAAELEARFAAAAAAVDEALSRATATQLGSALDAYLEAYRVIAELGRVIAAARRVLVDRLVADGATVREAHARSAELAPRRPSSLVAAVAAAARGEIDRAALMTMAGDFAPAWDVASPTFAETPHVLDEAIARARVRPAPSDEPIVSLDLADVVAIARAAADAAERDDVLFARTQAMVRRALLATAAQLEVAPDDVFWLPLDELRAYVESRDLEESSSIEEARSAAASNEDWHRRVPGRASAARAAAARAAEWEMPMVVAQGERSDSLARGERGTEHAQVAWTGDGLGGRAAGPAAKIEQPGEAVRVPRGAVVVTSAVTPMMALLVDGAAAIVCEHGSLLDHGAAMARELGIPCVVGCAGVLDGVLDGEWLDVDGDGGRVRRLG